MEIKRDEAKILDVLQRQGRLSNVELAKQVHMSESPCLRKTRALEQAGVVTGYRAEVDPKKIGCNVSALILVSLDKRSEQDSEAFFKAVQAEPRIVECLAITGPNDLLMRVVVKDIEELGNLTIEGILRSPTVKDVDSCVVVKQIKALSPLPVML